MSEKQDGGPAFPLADITSPESGMSLRDYFAAAALQGMNACLVQAQAWPEDVLLQEMVGNSYRQADAMLAERSKQ